MPNLLFQPGKIYTKHNSKYLLNVGGIKKTNKIINIQKMREEQEEKILNFAYKISRSEKQREMRRSKRK